jgi:hypothetical protein
VLAAVAAAAAVSQGSATKKKHVKQTNQSQVPSSYRIRMAMKGTVLIYDLFQTLKRTAIIIKGWSYRVRMAIDP